MRLRVPPDQIAPKGDDRHLGFLAPVGLRVQLNQSDPGDAEYLFNCISSLMFCTMFCTTYGHLSRPPVTSFYRGKP